VLDVPRPARRAFFERTPAPLPKSRVGGPTLRAGSGSFESEESDPTAALARRLDAIQQMLQDLGRSNPAPRHAEVPGELFQLYTELIDGEVEDEVARELICQLKQSTSPRQLSDTAAAKALLTARVESEIRCCEPIMPRPGRRKVVALVGATGVGKTTTIAKLAANFRLRSGIKMGLVTVDTYRVAAVEQLRTYAEIIELPMKVVTNPLEMRRALDELAGLDLVLIDTAGRSPKDDLQIQELKSLLAEAHVDEVHLVLSLTASSRVLEASAAKFAAAGTTAMILTKLDEASGMGALLSVVRRINLPISYLTAGQAVPDDIEPAHPRRIARLILGQERVAK
jgi:flagellar biosynthesis protein FlhF